MSEIFRFGAVRVGGRPIKKGLLYEDERGAIARVHGCENSKVFLDWVFSGRQSVCAESQFRKRFSLYGNGHE